MYLCSRPSTTTTTTSTTTTAPKTTTTTKKVVVSGGSSGSGGRRPLPIPPNPNYPSYPNPTGGLGLPSPNFPNLYPAGGFVPTQFGGFGPNNNGQYYPPSYGKRNVEIESSVQVIFDFCNDNGDFGLTWNEVEACEVTFSME